ncbi:IS110 family transposase, partial [Massilia sp. CFBP 13647]
MNLVAFYKRVLGLDVHQAQITACAMIEDENGEPQLIQRQFGTFKRDRKALAEWAASLKVELVVMESTGIYWKS